VIRLEEITSVVSDDITAYEAYLRRTLHSGSGYAAKLLDYIFDARGKGVRPLLVLLGAAMNRGSKPLNERTCVAAMLVEMIHTVSLVHDDVVDEAFTRRGKPTVNALWGAKDAVLIGDFLLARSFARGMESGYYDIVTYIAKSIDTLCEGEFTQRECSRRFNTSMEVYINIATQKTASLMGVSAGAGAMAVGAPESMVDALHAYGIDLGIAFQMRDDVLDYVGDESGKPLCGDLRERTMTLPLILVLENSSKPHRKEILSRLAEIKDKPSNVEYLHGMVISEGGVEMANEQISRYISSAVGHLGPLRESPYKNALKHLADFVATRSK